MVRLIKEGQISCMGAVYNYRRMFTVLLILIQPTWAAASCHMDSLSENQALTKTTHASSPTNPSSLTVDGQRSEYDESCMNTEIVENPWLVVDLHETVSVSTIVVTALDTDYLATTEYQVLVGDTFDVGTFDPLTSGYESCIPRPVRIKEYESEYVHCEGTLTGRYILIYRQNVTSLRVCELEVYVEQEYQPEKWTCIKPELQRATGTLNLARGRDTYQSSSYESRGSVRAVDGNDDPEYFGNSCAQTDGGTNNDVDNWWVMDLGENTAVTAVVITNRNFIDDWKLENYKIWVGNVSGVSTPFVASDYEVVVDQCGPQSQGRHHYRLEPPVNGNHVAFTMTGWIMLCEVEVYSDNLHDVSFPTWTMQNTIPPLPQNLLYDNNDNTCLIFGSEYPSLRVNPLTIEIPWDPTARTGLAERTADYYCNQHFYVNIIHSDDVQTLVIIKDEVLDIGAWILQGRACTLIGDTGDLDVVRVRYACFCEGQCAVVVQARRGYSNSNGDSRVCTINVYD